MMAKAVSSTGSKIGEIPEPEGLSATDTWKATATLKKDNSVVYAYTITHNDGTATERLVSKNDGTLSLKEEKKIEAPPIASDRPKIGPPRNLPDDGSWSAKRQIFTDERGDVKIRVVYEVETPDKKWIQTEEQLGFDGPVTVLSVEDVTPPPPSAPRDSTASFEDDGDDEAATPDAPAAWKTAVDDVVANEEKDPSPHQPEEAPSVPTPPAPAPTPAPTVVEVKPPQPPEEEEEEDLPLPPIGPPVALPQGAGWKARRESKTADGRRTVTTTYVVTHGGKQWDQTETSIGDDPPTVVKSAIREIPVAASTPIGAPQNLPAGAGWKASRETKFDENGTRHVTTTYEITHAGTIFEQKEVQRGDDPAVVVEKGAARNAPETPLTETKPITDPIDLPAGAGWKAKRSIVKNEQGVTTIETTYTITLRGVDDKKISKYTQKEVQVGDGEITVTKTPPQ